MQKFLSETRNWLDEIKKDVHNLVSLLLTNKTICRRAAKMEAKAEIWGGRRRIFKNQTVDKCGHLMQVHVGLRIGKYKRIKCSQRKKQDAFGRKLSRANCQYFE